MVTSDPSFTLITSFGFDIHSGGTVITRINDEFMKVVSETLYLTFHLQLRCVGVESLLIAHTACVIADVLHTQSKEDEN